MAQLGLQALVLSRERHLLRVLWLTPSSRANAVILRVPSSIG